MEPDEGVFVRVLGKKESGTPALFSGRSPRLLRFLPVRVSRWRKAIVHHSPASGGRSAASRLAIQPGAQYLVGRAAILFPDCGPAFRCPNTVRPVGCDQTSPRRE